MTTYKRGRGPDPAQKKAIRPFRQFTFTGRHAREIHNGTPQVPYLPADPGRRERLLKLLQQANQAKEVS